MEPRAPTPPHAPILPFAFAAALSLLGAGLILLATGSLALMSHWSSLTLSLTHLGTLGFITAALVGVFYPLLTRITGVPVPAPRLVWVVWTSLVCGVASLCWGTARADSRFVFGAIGAIGVVMGPVFVTQVAVALRRARVRDDSTRALRLAIVGFALAASLGVWLAHGHGGMEFPGPRGLWIQVHLCVGLLGWVGGVVCAVSWRVLPEAFGHPPPSARMARFIGRSLGVGILAPSFLLLADYLGILGLAPASVPRAAALLTLPAWLAVWILQPVMMLRASRSVAGTKGEGARFCWTFALATAPLVASTGVLTLVMEDPRVAMLFGWLALFGWAGSLVHGMLAHGVPQLLAGGTRSLPVPDDAGLTAPGQHAYFARVGFLAHVVTLLVGSLSIMVVGELGTRLTGAGLVATSLLLIAAISSGVMSDRQRAD